VVVVVVASVDADEVALRRGIVVFGMRWEGALRRNARIAANVAKAKKRKKARVEVCSVTVKAVARGARGRKKGDDVHASDCPIGRPDT
jgi:hypothetical protein